jgi:asparagine synthase (glutamine-hydrolysing)
MWQAMLNPVFLQRTGLTERYVAWRQAQSESIRSERSMHYHHLVSGIHPLALEVLDRAVAAFSLELRYPFWDKRLVEFCLALPAEQKLHQGWSRMIMRRALAGIIPVEVQWRTTKMDFLPNFRHGLLAFERERLDRLILREAAIIEEYVDVPTLQGTYRRFIARPSHANPQDVFAIWRAVSLALWLGYVYGEEELS